MTTSMSRRHLFAAGGAAAAVLATTGLPSPATAAPAPARRHGADLVLAWNRELLATVRTPGLQPATVHPTRGFALLHAAIHDAVVATAGTGRPYLFTVDVPGTAAPEAAAAQAAHDVLAALYPTRAGEYANLLAAQLAAVHPAGRDAGVRAGRLVAKLLLGLRTGDGSAAVPPVLPPGTAPGQYRPTPPAFAPAAFTHWAAVTPFVLDRASRFRPGPYPALDSARYAKAVREVAAAGRDTSTTRTADETLQARFWAAPIWNYWNEIAQSVVGGSRSGLLVAARVFARLNLTFADAVIAFYEAKYHYRIWRPITAIRLAEGVPDWSSLATTPADPAYPGAHSVISQAGALVLRQEYGPRWSLAVSSEALPGVVRRFTTFQDVADEAGLSRIVAGVHTRLDHEAGRQLGTDVAAFVLRS